MCFNRGEIKVEATNISVMDRKGESTLGCRVVSGAITATVSVHSHLDSSVRNVPGDSLHSTTPGIGGHTGRCAWHVKKMGGMYS